MLNRWRIDHRTIMASAVLPCAPRERLASLPLRPSAEARSVIAAARPLMASTPSELIEVEPWSFE
jgi:hypothetical protein